MLDMINVIVPDALQPGQHHVRGLKTDGAVGGIRDVVRGLFDQSQRIHRRRPVQNLLQEVLQLPEPDPAGHALSAGLRVTQLQKRKLKIHRTKSRRTGDNMTLQILVQPFYRKLRLIRCADFQSAHKSNFPFLSPEIQPSCCRPGTGPSPSCANGQKETELTSHYIIFWFTCWFFYLSLPFYDILS